MSHFFKLFSHISFSRLLYVNLYQSMCILFLAIQVTAHLIVSFHCLFYLPIIPFPFLYRQLCYLSFVSFSILLFSGAVLSFYPLFFAYFRTCSRAYISSFHTPPPSLNPSLIYMLTSRNPSPLLISYLINLL